MSAKGRSARWIRELQQIQGTLVKLVAPDPGSLSYGR